MCINTDIFSYFVASKKFLLHIRFSNTKKFVAIAILLLSFLLVGNEFLISSIMASSSKAKLTLYDVPMSNNGARVRIILYKKNIPFDTVNPFEMGGLKTDFYLKLNPQGKMPCLTIDSMSESLPESDTICRYLLHTYENEGPTFLPNSSKSNLIARLHDMYLTTIQSCFYGPTPPFGIYSTRIKAIDEFEKQLSVIDDLVSDDGLYLTGDYVSLADATIFPTLVLAKFLLPKFGRSGNLPTKLEKYYNSVLAADSDFNKVYEELISGLQGWDASGHWDQIWLAGLRDNDPKTTFDEIVAGTIPASIVYDDDDVLAFKDINPVAPAHLLVIPKDRANLSGLRKASDDHIEILGKLLKVAGNLSKDESLGFSDGARLVINDGPDAGQEVAHLHIHVLGGRSMTWPPG